jgi:translation initiation factor 2 subunit 2
MTAMFEGLAKKKKKSSSKKEKSTDDAEAPAADAEFDPSALKKKKKKAKKAEADDFEAKLAEAGANEEANDDEPVSQPSTSQEGDLEKGTGIWQHSNTTPIEYPLLLTRFFSQLNHHNPDLASSGGKSYKIPPPQCLREGNKKTIFANISEICRRMKRTDEHVTQFLFSELGTSGSVAGQGQLVIKGRFQQKQLENVLRRYIGTFFSFSSLPLIIFCAFLLPTTKKKKPIQEANQSQTVEYVTCKTCRSPDTELNKGENRLYFVTCNSCGSRRSVSAIKTGFSAQIGKRRRQQA